LLNDDFRVASLLSFRSQLREELDLDLRLFELMKHESLAQALLDRYSSPLCPQCSSTSSPSSLGDMDSSPTNLIVVTDDGLHPHIDYLLQSLHDHIAQSSLSLPVSRSCIHCSASIASAVLQSVMSFDNLSVVPCRELLRECAPDPLNLDTDITLKEILTRYHSPVLCSLNLSLSLCQVKRQIRLTFILHSELALSRWSFPGLPLLEFAPSRVTSR
jgi:hypothetical protein